MAIQVLQGLAQRKDKWGNYVKLNKAVYEESIKEKRFNSTGVTAADCTLGRENIPNGVQAKHGTLGTGTIMQEVTYTQNQ